MLDAESSCTPCSSPALANPTSQKPPPQLTQVDLSCVNPPRGWFPQKHNNGPFSEQHPQSGVALVTANGERKDASNLGEYKGVIARDSNEFQNDPLYICRPCLFVSFLLELLLEEKQLESGQHHGAACCVDGAWPMRGLRPLPACQLWPPTGRVSPRSSNAASDWKPSPNGQQGWTSAVCKMGARIWVS